MNPGRDPYAAGIVALALAFHRAPVAHPDLLHGRAPLPPGIGALLKLAGGSEPDPATAALASPDELRAAALFFIEQVLLHHDASHYRVLGLEPGAAIEQIKEHHRLLMRVFHPDRERHDGDWKDAFAIRINLAYTNLHDAEARRRYDATLQAAARPAAPPARRTGGLHAKGARPRGVPVWLLRFLPQWVLAGTALLALAIVGAVYVSNPPLPAAVASKLPAEVPLAAATPLAPETPRPAVAEREGAASSAAADKPVIAAAEIPHTPTAVPAQPLARPAPPILPEPAVPADRLGVSQAVKTAIGPQAAPAPASQAEVPAPPTARPPAPEPAVAAAPQPAKLDPNATVERFMAAYERGDTPAFMALFDELAIGSAGGKTQIRRDHEALFRSTDLRHIDIDGMTWTQEGDWMRGEGRYRTTLMRKGTLRLETAAGLIHIALLRRGDQALIVALEYQPGESA